MLTAILLGWRWGAAVTLGCAIAANRILIRDPLEMVEPVDFFLAALFLTSCALLVATADLARKLIRQIEAAKGREEMLKHELLHRVQNMLATVSAMAAMTARYTPPDQYRAALTGRLEALQRATALLGSIAASDRTLGDILESSLAPFRTPQNIILEGPECRLSRDACVPLSLAIHELCTNAVKHGALSVPEGHVEIRWRVAQRESFVELIWREHGGPTVEPPTRKGMGTQLLRRQLELGDVQIDYAVGGLVCTMTVKGTPLGH